MNLDLSEKELIQMYWEQTKSLRDIAETLGCNKETVRQKMIEYNIPRRTTSQARQIEEIERKKEIMKKMEEDLESLEPLKYDIQKRENIFVPLPLKAFKKNSAGEARVTVVISDTHLGDTDFLPRTYKSTVNGIVEVLRVLNERFTIPHLNLILNGDIVCGKKVFRFQEFRTLLDRGHWQTALAEMIIRETIEKIEEELPIKKIYLIKGTHEGHGENYAMYIKRSFDNAVYGGDHIVYNIGEDLGFYNILFTHGYGSSDYGISNSFIRDMWMTVAKYHRRNIPIERVCIGHYHMLSTGQTYESFILDVSGGFQRWEKSISQRPSGCLMYLFYDDEATVIPVRPREEIINEELEDPGLEYKNMRFYSEKLLEHLKKVEHIEA